MTTLQGRSVLLLCVAALGAAGMFLGPDGWRRIGFGRIGSAVLYVALTIEKASTSFRSSPAYA